MRRHINTIVFWGAIWGIIEASLGYILHNNSLNIGWAIWFPLAFYFMNKVYKKTGSLGAVFLLACITACIKFVDLLLPVRIDKVFNPAVSIILESIAVMVTFRILERKDEIFKIKYQSTLLMSIGWRFLYILYIFLLPVFFIQISPARGIEPLLRFMFVESIVNSLVIYIYARISKSTVKEIRVKEVSLNPILSFGLLAFAIFVQWRF